MIAEDALTIQYAEDADDNIHNIRIVPETPPIFAVIPFICGGRQYILVDESPRTEHATTNLQQRPRTKCRERLWHQGHYDIRTTFYMWQPVWTKMLEFESYKALQYARA